MSAGDPSVIYNEYDREREQTLVEASYFIGNKFYGTSKVPGGNPLYKASSIAMCCPVCGEIWGRIVVQNAHWVFVVRPCIEHKPVGVLDWGAVPGSLLTQNLDPDYCINPVSAMALPRIPDKLLEYEFELTLSWLEKKLVEL